MINWHVSREDSETISQICTRVAREQPVPINRMEMSMDITAVHANGCPIDLAGLLEAEPFDFWHDIGGIRRHVDRTTGRLTDCFLPRYAARDAVEAAGA